MSEDSPPDGQSRHVALGDARFAAVDLTAPIDHLAPSERSALVSLVRAAGLIDALFLRQVWAANEATLLGLLASAARDGRERLARFLLNKGPWSRLDDHRPFLPGVPPKPPGANFYPADATKSEVEAWLATLPDGERSRATGFFTTIRRDETGGLVAVPYRFEYQGELAQLSSLLTQAAASSREPTLTRFLELRARAFLTDDYYASDVAWMELDSPIEPTIGPYEVYEDEWFNYKAAFEAFIAVRDDDETARLARFGRELQGIENRLPIDPRFRNPAIGGLTPIRVVNTLISAGDGNRGVQTAAFNLPNDERVVAAKGSKSVLLKNNQHAKFTHVLTPIAQQVLAPADRGDVRFDAFFTHILLHELMHGLGPHGLTCNGRQTTVRHELQEAHSAIEEAKADIGALFAAQCLFDDGVLPAALEAPLYTTYLASMFRTLRFGITEAHGRGVAIQLNYLLNAGGVVARGNGTFTVERAAFRAGVVGLTREIMTTQAEGDLQGARRLIDTLGDLRPDVRATLDRLAGVPVDIRPRFVTAEQLLAPLS